LSQTCCCFQICFNYIKTYTYIFNNQYFKFNSLQKYGQENIFVYVIIIQIYHVFVWSCERYFLEASTILEELHIHFSHGHVQLFSKQIQWSWWHLKKSMFNKLISQRKENETSGTTKYLTLSIREFPSNCHHKKKTKISFAFWKGDDETPPHTHTYIYIYEI